uniref:Uncharacterized protein n=1 Tax=Periophthalmus magnuspinnatus TaxID=409849 RepID=A0A3B4BM41_9GOBI
MSGQPPQRRPANVGSMLLTPQENECLFNHLGRKCMSLSSAVVQVFTAERNSSWSKRCCGVACLVKDNPLRSYFIRVFDLRDGKMMFEQELYNNFNLSSSRPYFITFTGDTCQVGLNFANEEEAKQFRRNVSDLVGRKQRKTEKRRDPPNGMFHFLFTQRPSLPMATVDIKNPEISVSRFHNNSQVNNLVSSPFPKRERKPKGGKKKKLTKADIGTPSNFQHIGHVGWDPNTGFDLNNLDPELKNLFDMCGISETDLKDKETSKVIYDFIEKKGGVEAVKNELRRQGKMPTCYERSALLSQIREGTQLKKVDQKERPVSSVGRDALLDQIRQGIQLKPVSTPAPSAGIVGALMEVMQKRSKAIHSSDEDDDDDEDEDFDDEDEWED